MNFELVPDLVESRSVDLLKGFAKIDCSKWRYLLCSLFRTFITHEVRSQIGFMEREVSTDPRLNSLYRRIQYKLQSAGFSCGLITAANIDKEVANFPPCMQHLHGELRRKHRLSHYARFYYTLFLKECGMKLEDSISYWKGEYSQPHLCSATCVHDWQTDAKKFTYSIRHMYGLEGGRKNYSAPNCSRMCVSNK